MTQQELADAAGVDLKTVYNLESGGRWPNARTRAAVAGALGWDGGSLAAIRAGEDIPADAAVPPGEAADSAVVTLARQYGINPDDPKDPWIRPVREEIAAAIMRYGADASGEQIFSGAPASHIESAIWNDPGANRASKEVFIAAMRADRAQNDARRRSSSGWAGLRHPAASGVT